MMLNNNAPCRMVSTDSTWLVRLTLQEGGTSTTTTPPQPGKGAVGLVSLYGWATRLTPKNGNSNNDTYIRLWIGYARHQWCES